MLHAVKHCEIGNQKLQIGTKTVFADNKTIIEMNHFAKNFVHSKEKHFSYTKNF